MAKRLQDLTHSKKSETKGLPNPVKFGLPKFELNLGFFLNKGNEPFTVDSLLRAVFGDQNAYQFTPAEQMYVILKAMEDLEIIAPIPMQCPHCNETYTAAVNLPKAMKTKGESLQEFYIEEGKYMLKFVRPQRIEDTSNITSPVASIGVFMLQWLDAHNQGEDFDVLKMPLPDMLKILEKFGEFLFGVSFDVMSKCDKCGKKHNHQFEVGLQDLVDILNEI